MLLRFLNPNARFSATLVSLLPLVLLLVLLGCKPGLAPPDENESRAASNSQRAIGPIHLTIIGGGDLAQEIQRLWTTTQSHPLTIQQIPLDDYDNPKAVPADTDVLLYPTLLKTSLAAEEILQPISETIWSDRNFNARGILPAERGESIKWAGKIIGASLGEPRPMLFYRRDLMEQFQLQVPRSWAAFDRLAERVAELRASAAAEQRPALHVLQLAGPAAESGHSPAAVLDFSLGKMLMLRASNYLVAKGQFSTFFDASSMEPLLDTPPFVRALTELKDSAQHCQFVSARKALEHITQGKCLLAISWMSAAHDLSDAPIDPEIAQSVHVAPLPGSQIQYSFAKSAWESKPEQPGVMVDGLTGYLVSSCSTAQRRSDAERFVTWLTSKSVSTQLNRLSPFVGMSRASHLGQPQRWAGDYWSPTATRQLADVTRAYDQIGLRCSWLPIKAARRYAAELETGIQQAMDGAATPEQVLNQVKQRWETITDELGRDSQRAAYRQAIGLVNQW